MSDPINKEVQDKIEKLVAKANEHAGIYEQNELLKFNPIEHNLTPEELMNIWGTDKIMTREAYEILKASARFGRSSCDCQPSGEPTNDFTFMGVPIKSGIFDANGTRIGDSVFGAKNKETK